MWRRQNKNQMVEEEKRSGRLVDAAETSKERAEWRKFQRKNLRLSLTAPSTSADYQVLEWRLIRPKEWKIWPHSVPERKREQKKRKEKETSISLQKNSGSQRRRQSHPSELSKN